MAKIFKSLLFSLFIVLTPLSVSGKGEHMSDVIVNQGSEDLLVSTTLLDGFSKNFEDAVKNGFEKEIIFYIEIYRRWSLWPDEFILFKRVQKTVKYDELKKLYYTSSYDGLYLEEKVFDDYERLKAWVSKLVNVKITPLGLLKPKATYFIRIKAESKFKRLPPVLENILFFVPTKDFETPWKKSNLFSIKGYKK